MHGFNYQLCFVDESEATHATLQQVPKDKRNPMPRARYFHGYEDAAFAEPV